MKKLLLSLALIITFAFYAMLSSSRSSNIVAGAPTATSINPATPEPRTVQTSSAVISVANAPGTGTNKGSGPATGGQYKDGAYTGPVADAYFGSVQISAAISGGKLSDVSFLQYPNDRRTSEQINQQAMPILVDEAVAAQSANVDIVSGATQTSQAFKESLSAALAQAAK